MSEADIVKVDVSVAAATSPTVANLNTPLAAVYHTHFPDRVRLYAFASALTAMVADGFQTTEPAYKMVEAMGGAENTPALVAIGRRANKPLQTLNLACVDGTVGDAYAVTLVGSDGKSHALAYTNVIELGAPLAGGTALSGTATVTKGSNAVTFSAPQSLTAGEMLAFSSQAGVAYQVAAATTSSTTATLTAIYTGTSSATATVTPGATAGVTNGSTAVTFSLAQTLAAGALLTFQSEPGVYYALATAVTAATSGTLTSAYQGATAAATYATAVAPLSGTADAVNGSSTVATTASQVGSVYPGDSVQFVSQLGTYYTVEAVTATQITLTQPYTGTTSSSVNFAAVCTAATAALNLAAQIAPLTGLGTASVIASVAPSPNAGESATVQLARTDGALTDVQDWTSNGFASIQLTDVTADPGIAADLAAILAASTAWYSLSLDSNSQAEIEAAAQWIEATGTGGKVGLFNSSDYGNEDTAVTTDLFSVLKADSYSRSFAVQNNTQLLCYAGAAIASDVLARNPGSYTLGFQTLPGVPADSGTTLTEAQQLAINSMSTGTPGPGAKNGNWYATVAGENIVFPGCAPSGRFFDITIFCDWLAVTIQQRCFAVLTGAASAPGKLPYTDDGLSLLGEAVQGVLRLGATPAYGGIVPDGADPTRPIVVDVQTVASIDQTDRTNRNVPAGAITYSAGLTGAVETLTVQGTVSP